MKKSDFIFLHLNLKVQCPKMVIVNPLPSATDPTQDVPVRMIELAANGVPINVNVRKNLVMSNLKIENMSVIDMQHTDVFDALGELQQSANDVSRVAKLTKKVQPKKEEENEK